MILWWPFMWTSTRRKSILKSKNKPQPSEGPSVTAGVKDGEIVAKPILPCSRRTSNKNVYQLLENVPVEHWVHYLLWFFDLVPLWKKSMIAGNGVLLHYKWYSYRERSSLERNSTELCVPIVASNFEHLISKILDVHENNEVRNKIININEEGPQLIHKH